MKKTPIASAIASVNAEKHNGRNPNAVILNGIEVYGRKYGTYSKNVGYMTHYHHTVESGADNYRPTRKPIINRRSNPWDKLPPYLREDRTDHAIRKLVNSFGMNKSYCDTFLNPFAK